MYVVADNGEWVHEHFERLASIIKDYNPDFELQWIPPKARETQEEHRKPYRIIHHSKTKGTYVVFWFGEFDTPEQVLARLFAGDLSKHHPDKVWAELMAAEAARKALQLKEEQDRFEQAEDEAKFLFQNPLHTKKFNGHKLDHNLRRIGPAVDRKNL